MESFLAGVMTSSSEQLVDSNTYKLNAQQIVMIGAAQSLGDQFTPTQVWATILTELQQKISIAIQFGNTIYLITNTKLPGTAFFRALNADTAKNYVNNSKQFIKFAQHSGYHTLVTQYDDEAISKMLRVVKHTGQDYYDPGTRLEIVPTKDGGKNHIPKWQATIVDTDRHHISHDSLDGEFHHEPDPKKAGGLI